MNHDSDTDLGDIERLPQLQLKAVSKWLSKIQLLN